MGSSNASRNGRGVTASAARHAKRAFDEGEDDLFALSLDDVMSDRPWTAEELMGGGVRPTSAKPAPSATPAPVSVPADGFATRPIVQTTRKAAPAPHPASDPSETAAFLAAAAQGKSADSTVMYSAQQLPVPAVRKPPVTRLDEPVAHQVAYDSWAAADLDETSTGMPALDVPVNPLFATNTSAADYESSEAYSDYSDGHADTGRIETEDYGTASSDYLNDPYAATPAPEYDPEAASTPAYTKSTGEERFADYYAAEKALRFTEFPQAVKVAFIAIIIALLGVIAFEGFQLFRGPTQAESETQQKEDDNQHLDINTLKGDPNDGDE
ncbi:Uncharacterised protein [Collinsella aerofaciens]|uniref:Uncharacterized protein n=1 Tax=Collinsella aerofaciens TaxID=74426 RepID=A0A6N3DQQ8_9ACTN